MDIYIGQEEKFKLVFDSDPVALAMSGKTYADIEDVSVNLKWNTATDADDAYCEALMSVDSGVVIDESTHSFNVTFTSEQTQSLMPNAYALVFAIKVTGVDKMLENFALADTVANVLRDRQRA